MIKPEMIPNTPPAAKEAPRLTPVVTVLTGASTASALSN